MSTFFIELKYARMLGGRLPNFKQKRGELFEFTHTCEEQRPGKRARARAYLYKVGERLNMKCHHCGASMSFSKFLGQTDPMLYDDYRLETYKEKVDRGDVIERVKAERKTQSELKTELRQLDSVLDGLVCLLDLPETHPAVRYVKRRAIPEKHYKLLFFVAKFNAFAAKYKEAFKSLDPSKEHPRLVLPYFDANGRVYAFTARAFGPEEPKYIYISVDGRNERVYGLDRVDLSKKIIAVEGQIDSLCVDNALAVGGADYSSLILQKLKTNLIVVPDNDFVRNKQVADQVARLIKQGFTVSLMPETFPHKDLNDAVKSGFTPEQLRGMIEQNAKSGLAAELELTFRRKN